MITFPFTTTALRVNQPIGTFYVAVLPAELLLRVAASDRMSASINPDGTGYTLSGTQRLVQDKRLNQIADYIDRVDAAFPNSIILAANYDRGTGLDQDELEAIQLEESEGVLLQAVATEQGVHDSRSWTVTETEDGCHKLTIPSDIQLAAIIDGQHRLFAFAKADPGSRLGMQLICAIFLDLPKPYQAQLFATINSTQKAVDRSLTFELFGYNVSDEPEELWTPDKLAVFLTRKLGTEVGSPLRGRISVAPKRDAGLQALADQASWRVSTAVVVDGILRLISSNPKRDANAMRTQTPQPRSALASGPKDRSPLRDVFIQGNDTLLYKLVENYLTACNNVLWVPARAGSYISKSVGVQALLDILRKIAPEAYDAKDLRVVYFEDRLKNAATIDFAAAVFQVPAGAGRSAIRKAVETAIGL